MEFIRCNDTWFGGCGDRVAWGKRMLAVALHTNNYMLALANLVIIEKFGDFLVDPEN